MTTLKLDSESIAAASPQAFQIVRINDDGTRFTLDEEALQAIFHQVPEDMKVAIYSVVGAFRTGKSFLLDLFLRYLRFAQKNCDFERDAIKATDRWKQWMYTGLDISMRSSMLEGNSNVGVSEGARGFSWRAGRKRNTTGIWMWNQAFIRKAKNGEDIAVFLIDTQGMFDSETSQMLTASIFGLSTLLSSYQIYNVDKRVQEDNLQHLALFSEYGRMALFGSDDTNKELQALDSKCLSIRKTHLSTASSSMESCGPDEGQAESGDSTPRPFQRLDFLVRDWQDFSKNQDLAQKRQDMEQYTKELLSLRTQKDLAVTREQINACFEKVDCYLLPHPGYEVTDRDYDGNVEAIDIRFLELLTAYLDDLFDPSHIVPKYIHGVPVTSRELLTFIKYYAALFRDSSIFPEAKTLLEATSEANNVNMKDKALLKYKKEMEVLVGLKSKYVAPEEVEVHHTLCMDSAIMIFDQGAKMGRRSQILSHRAVLMQEIAKERERFLNVNAERNPYKNLEFYLIPSILAFGLLIFRIGQDLFCYEHIGYDIPIYDCKHVSNTLTHLYWAILIFMLLIALSTGQVMFSRMKMVAGLVKAAAFTDEKQKAE